MSNQSIRIRTTPGESKNIRFKLEQDFDFLEILSLRISQEDLYQTFCSNYGVVIGRVIANKGFGVPNAKVSIFIPISGEDEKNLILKDFYPFKTPYEKNREGIRYNLLLSKSTCELNKAVGSFPTKEEVLEDDLVLEVFDKYYKYTTKTNSAGDFMIFGVPVGSHTIHMDVDFSDAGSLSIRPYDLIADGYPEKLFESKTEFKASINLDSLPQIKAANIGIDVIPFWGNSETCEIGITRADIDTNFDIKSTALFFGSIFTDSGKMNLNKGCNPRNDMGQQDNLTTKAGRIDMIRVKEIDPVEWYTNNNIVPIGLEKFTVDGGDLIDDDGVFAFPLPMNIGQVITNEFGLLVPSPDPGIGLATKGMYRFKMKFSEPNENPKFRTATLLFPSLGPDFGGTIGMVDGGSLQFANGTTDQRWTDDICQYNTTARPLAVCGGTSGAIYDSSRIFLDFHTFEYKQLYTIAHFIKKYKKGGNRFSSIGIKNTDVSGETNFFPFTNAIWKFDILYYIISFIVDFIALFIKLLLYLINLCIIFCIRVTIPQICIAKACVGPWNIINICKYICPFGPIGLSIGSFNLPCEGAPGGTDSYEIPPNGDWCACNPNSCCGSFACNCPSNPCGPNDFQVTSSGANSGSGVCLDLLEDWKCCVKYNVAEDRNVIRRVFNDAWVFGTAYLFQFKYKRKVKKSTGALKKEKFCGPGADHGRGDNYVQNQCCIDTETDDSCDKCLLRGPGLTKNGGFRQYHESFHNYAIQQGKTGSADIDDIIYCNALMSTKIVSLGRIEMCLETLEDIEASILTGTALKDYTQGPNFYTGTNFESGWDGESWYDYLKESSYEDPRDVFLYLLHNTSPKCSPRDMFEGSGLSGSPCHEYELTGNNYFFIKEVSKIYTDIDLGGQPPNEEEFLGGIPLTNGINSPYADMANDPPQYGGFLVDAAVASRFSPCGGTGNCNPLPTSNNWINNNPSLSPNLEQATNNGWDRFVNQGNRNNINSRSNIPYYYFGIRPGKTAINKLRKEYFLPR